MKYPTLKLTLVCLSLATLPNLQAQPASADEKPAITSLIEWYGIGLGRKEGHRVHPARRQVQPILDHPLRDPSICQGPEGWYYLTRTDGTPILPQYGKDLPHDFGEVIEITPERAAVIHDSVWELLREHPQANLNLN